MNFRSTAAVTAALTVFACGQQVVAEDETATAGVNTAQSDALKQTRAGSTIAMRVRTSASQPGPFATSFSINATYDLFFAFDFPSTKSGSHVAAFEVFTPGGALYQRTDVAFAAGQAAVGNEVQADLISGGFRVWASMPLAGTMIQQSAMTGKWSTKVLLDGVPVASSTYTLNP
jgi:hypothetical protein